jgi:sugar lactone lactonase YvrE
VAGDESGPDADNIPATSAALNLPSAVAVDSAGNLYIADTYHNRIRLVSNGIITTVAGGRNGGYNGDNGPAASAELWQPEGVAVGAGGTVYIADYRNSRVRKVSAGVITTVAGTGTAGYGGDNGAAANAELSYPAAVTLDSTGNLYIADFMNNRIREVAGGVIATVVGNETAGYSGDGGQPFNAQLSQPWAVAVDAAGNLYIADAGSNAIREVSNGLIAAIAGNGMSGSGGDGGAATSAQLNGPQGVALDAAGNVYIADTYNSRIREISNGAIATVAGNGKNGDGGDGGPASAAELFAPAGIAVDSFGNLYIADTLNSRVRKVSSGIIATVAGNGGTGYSGDNGPAASAELNWPGAVAVDAAGALYIADTGNDCIRMVKNGVITTVAGDGTMAFGGDNGPATSAQLNSPGGVAVDAAGNLYIADTGNGRIRMVSNGVIRTIAGDGTMAFNGDVSPATGAEINLPEGLAVDSGGDVLFAESGNDRLRTLIPSSNGVTCSVSVAPSVLSSPAAGGSYGVTVQAGSTCAWAVQSLPSWITYSGSVVGTGNASIALDVAANTGSARTGTVSIAGVTVTVNQANAVYSYLLGDVAPYTSDAAPNFGDGALNILDLIQELFAVNNVPGFRPAACSDRFDAMDLYPADTASARGGDGVLDIRDLTLELFRSNNLDLSRPVRASMGGALPWAACSGASSGNAERPARAAAGSLTLGRPEKSGANQERVALYLYAAIDLTRVAVTFALGDQQSQLHFAPAAETQASLAHDGQLGVVAAAWLNGVSAPAGKRLLLGYVSGPAGFAAKLKVYGLSASGLDDGREVRLEAPGTGGLQR